MHHGASEMCVRSNMLSLALVYCSQRALDWTSMGLSFHCLSGEWIVDAHEEAKLLLLVADGKPVLQQDDARTHQHALEFGNGMEELLVLFFRAESHDPLDAGAVVPAAAEQDDFSAGRKMRHVALKIPLGSFALAGSRQRGDPADPRIEALRDPFDDPTLSRRVAALEDDHDLQLVVHDPVLQFH